MTTEENASPASCGQQEDSRSSTVGKKSVHLFFGREMAAPSQSCGIDRRGGARKSSAGSPLFSAATSREKSAMKNISAARRINDLIDGKSTLMKRIARSCLKPASPHPVRDPHKFASTAQ
jgi:hypothetical protein